jgi:hypothetical protein
MDPVSNLSKIIETLRRRAIDGTARTSTREKAPATGGGSAAESSRASVQELQLRIVERIRQLDPKDADHKRRAARIFVESILAWEFGDKIMSDPRFFALVEHVQAAMESDASIDSTMKSMVEQISS